MSAWVSPPTSVCRDSRAGSPSSHRRDPSRVRPRVGDTSFQPAEILAALERHGVRYVVIGGLAATLHGSPVMTTDADIRPARERDDLDETNATPVTRPVTLDEIESIAIGAWILGTGGGGSPYLALLNLRRLYREGTVVSLMDPAELADEDRVAVVSNMGAPLVGQERLTDPRTIAQAVRMMEDVIGQRFRAVMSLEIGGGNSLQPFMAAALLGLPVVDADCMGRAFPEAQMTSFAIHDLRMYPLTLADVRDNA